MTGGGAPPRELPVAAHCAWRAYLAMLDTKQAHYGCLEEFERRYQDGGSPTLAERAQLETLLAAHDRCVAEFSSAIKELGATDAGARDVLVGLMTKISETNNDASH